jgi:proline iminopeptidase
MTRAAILAGLLVPTLAAAGPVVEGTLPREYVRLAYRSYGSGTPVLLLAGGPGIDAVYFEPLAESLAVGHRAVLLHQRGTGPSTLDRVDAETVSLALSIRDVEALREAAGVDRWVLLGHSWGGILAMAYAEAHPDRVRGLVLVGSGGVTSDWMRYYADNVLSRLDGDGRRAAAFWTEPDRFLADPDRAVLEYSRATAPAMVFERDAALPLVERALKEGAFRVDVNRAFLPDLLSYDFRPGLARLEAPALVLQGRQDPVGETTAYDIARALPRARLHFLERCGHWPFVEREAEFLREVRGFLAGL